MVIDHLSFFPVRLDRCCFKLQFGTLFFFWGGGGGGGGQGTKF